VVRTYKPTGNPVGRPKKQPEVTSGPKDSIAARVMLDEESIGIIHNGISAAQLARMFQMKPESVRARIISGGVTEAGKNAMGHSLYHVRDVAPYLVKPVGDIEDHLRRMSHKDLPKDLTKEFWNGLNARTKYEVEAGQLWRTEEVVAGFSRVAKVLRMFLLTLPDHLDRKTTLSPQQRRLIQQLTDGALESIRHELRELFSSDLSDDDLEEDRAADPDAEAGAVEDAEAGSTAPYGPDDPAWGL